MGDRFKAFRESGLASLKESKNRTFKVGFHFFRHIPLGGIFRPYLIPMRFRQRSDGGLLQGIQGISLASFKALGNR